MRLAIFSICAIAAISGAPALALQSLDVPEQRTFHEKIPEKKKEEETRRINEQEFEISGTIQVEKSFLVICSEGAASGENLDAALEACNSAIEEAPGEGDAYYYRGIILSQLGKHEEAEADFSSAIDNSANRLAESYYWRGVAKENQRKLRDAAADFKKAAELKPDWSAARRKVEEYHWAFD